MYHGIYAGVYMGATAPQLDNLSDKRLPCSAKEIRRFMVATDRVNEIFADARALHQSALERLDAGDIRDAAEKALE